MNRFISLLIVFLSVTFSVHAQSFKGVKLYAYSQIVIPGVAPKDVITEDGKNVSTVRKQKKNMWVYLTHPSSVTLKQCEIYIDGVKYKAKAEHISKTPVTYTDYNIPDFPKTIVFVPKTTSRVALITPTETVKSTPSSTLKKMIKENQVVVAYIINGKRYYSAVKKFTVIEPAVAS